MSYVVVALVFFVGGVLARQFWPQEKALAEKEAGKIVSKIKSKL